MKNHRFPWRKQCLVGLSSLYLGSQLAIAQASTGFSHTPLEPGLQAVFSQTALPPNTLLLSQRIERRDGTKLREKLRHQPERRNSTNLFEHRASSVKQAAKMAQKQHGGKVLKVERQQQTYRVKMLRDGRVSYVKVPAQ